MKVSAIITLKKDVLDPQGKVIHQTLDGMGFKDVNEVRQGKYFEIDVRENDPTKAKGVVEDMFRYSVIQNSFSLYGAFFLIIKCGCVVFKVLNY